MSTAEEILKQIQLLPELRRQEVLDFARFLNWREESGTSCSEDAEWSALTLASALRGMEEEESQYSAADIKETFH